MTKGGGGMANAEITEKMSKMAKNYGLLSNSRGHITFYKSTRRTSIVLRI